MNLIQTIGVLCAIWTIGPYIPSAQAQSETQAETQADTQSETASGQREQSGKSEQHGILVVDESIEPIVTVRWKSRDGMRSVSAQLPYGPPIGGDILSSTQDDQPQGAWDGGNVRAYVALGGTRLDTGSGHPKGLIVRAGLTKVDSSKSFFEHIEAGSTVEIELTGVVLSQPVKYHQGSGMMHLKYAIGDLEACSLPGTARNQYLLSDPTDTLSGRVQAGINATPGALSGEDEASGGGSFQVRIDPDNPTKMSFLVRVPYGLLRHLQDPWDSTLPGTFFEPIHLHAEAEVIPVWATPIMHDWEPEINEDTIGRAGEESGREVNQDRGTSADE